jgi:hypothetical protein
MPKTYWNVDDPLFGSLPKFDKVYTQLLLDKLQSGDLTIKEELILQLLAICKIILKRRLYKNPALHRTVADLIGILMLKTCDWVQKLSNKDGTQAPTPEYYWQMIKNEVNNFNTDDTNPNVSGNWLRKQYWQGKHPSLRVKLKEDLLQINPTNTLDLEDILLSLAETEREREVIILRFHGFYESDIATKFNVTRQRINQILIELEKRYEAYLQKDQL